MCTQNEINLVTLSWISTTKLQKNPLILCSTMATLISACFNVTNFVFYLPCVTVFLYDSYIKCPPPLWKHIKFYVLLIVHPCVIL